MTATTKGRSETMTPAAATGVKSKPVETVSDLTRFLTARQVNKVGGKSDKHFLLLSDPAKEAVKCQYRIFAEAISELQAVFGGELTVSQFEVFIPLTQIGCLRKQGKKKLLKSALIDKLENPAHTHKGDFWAVVATCARVAREAHRQLLAAEQAVTPPDQAEQHEPASAMAA
jgi:hypothetical protein